MGTSRRPEDTRTLTPPAVSLQQLEAAYLHARAPADARVVLFAGAGSAGVAELLPQALRDTAAEVEFQILLPTEEASLRPARVDGSTDGETSGRVAPALWRIRGLGIPLPAAVEFLAALPHTSLPPTTRLLALAARVVRHLVASGSFAAPLRPGLLRCVPVWSEPVVGAVGALALIVPETLQTARFFAGEAPVYAVTARNLLVSFIGHAVDAVGCERTPPHAAAEPLPREFWRPRPKPVLEIQKPERELEEGVPWGIQLRLRPVQGVALDLPVGELQELERNRLFPNPISIELLADLDAQFEAVAAEVPALRRALSMTDGRASLNRAELDEVLDHLPLLESRGFDVRLPGLDDVQRLTAEVELVESPGADEGARPWFEFDWKLAIGGRPVGKEEFERLVQARAPLVQLQRGLVLLSPRDREALQTWRKAQQRGSRRIGFFEALRLRLGGAEHLHGLALERLQTSPRLEAVVAALEQSRAVEPRAAPPGFIGSLRPYQARGHAWLYFLMDQGFGPCLADDMGLGKTVQAIAVLLDWRLRADRRGPVLLVCPVSVLGNWRRELARFAPELRVVVHHGKGRAREPQAFATMLQNTDVVLTSYNLLQRDEENFEGTVFEGVVLDEAQNIKNPSTRQSRAARALEGKFRLALTGTPLENRPLDLWSIMDFLNEGLLGTRTSFQQTLEHPIIRQRNQGSASALARLVRPFVLRRLKTDPEIVTDLPEKTEQIVPASLTREQAVLYEGIVRKGMAEVEQALEGMQRRGAILTTLLRLKQICNHPAHFLMDGSPLPGRSGKLDLLHEMLEEALDEGDRCLVFTQFREMGSLLRAHFQASFGDTILFLHGGVPQREREEMVAQFQEGRPEGPKIFVLSLKAGGTGLNLTMANRVFHFDRWWNPAVEDQATDRAFRIGQNRNVFVHKFVCSGTLEERIQTMLERKREVAGALLGAGEGWLTELSNEDLRQLLALDRQEVLS